MSADWASIATVAVTAIFAAGGTYVSMKMRTRRNETDIRGVADFARARARRDDRRWKLAIANQVDALYPKETAHGIAQWLRDDAARD